MAGIHEFDQSQTLLDSTANTVAQAPTANSQVLMSPEEWELQKAEQESQQKTENRQDQVENFGLVCFIIFWIALVGVCIAGAWYILDPSGVEKLLRWNDEYAKGPLWLVSAPVIGTVLGAFLGGWLWSHNWLQKQQTNRIQDLARIVQERAAKAQESSVWAQDRSLKHQQEVLKESQEQFQKNQEKDNNQFQHRLLEERFNRILDDFASPDPASRAGAASRLASIAKELKPGVASGAPISEDNNPYYIHSVKQLARRLIMDDDKQVGSAIQAALADISSWTNGEAERADSPEKRKQIDEAQAELVNVLAETNRTAINTWLDAFAGYLIERGIKPLDDSEADLAENLMIQIQGDSKLLPSLKNRANWCYRDEDYALAVRDLIGHKQFRSSLLRQIEDGWSDATPSKETTERFALATQRLTFARDSLADSLRLLPAPVNLPSAELDQLERAKEFREWERQGSLNLSGVFLQGAYLYQAQMQGAYLTWAQMQGANLIEAQMQGANLIVAQMQGAYLSKAQMQGAYLSKAQMQGANLSKAQMQGAYLTWAQMQGANLIEAQMQGANLREAQMQGANLSKAQMQGAYLYQAQMQGAFVFEGDLPFCKIVPIVALRSEFRVPIWDNVKQEMVVPDRVLNVQEQAHYDAVVRKLIKQGYLSEELGARLIGNSPVGEGAVTIDHVLAEAKSADDVTEEKEPGSDEAPPE